MLVERFPAGDVKKLQKDSTQWRLRVGRIRVILYPDFKNRLLTVRHVYRRDRAYR